MAPPEFQRLETTESGSAGLAAWLDIDTNIAPIGFSQNILVPTQDMLPFQRKIRYIRFPQAVIPAAPTATNFNIDVPVGETWAVKEVQVQHTLAGPPVFQISTFTPGPLPNLVQVNMPVEGGDLPFSLFPGRATRPAVVNDEFFDRPSKVIELYERDSLIIGPQGSVTGAATIDCFVKIEILPKLLLRTRVDGNTSVV